jgi:copper chaperone NosL
VKPSVILAALLAFALLGCGKAPGTAALPRPQEPTAESVTHFCSMAVLDHSGPKGQIFLAGRPDPIWFASVRDAFAFTMLPEEPKNVAAIYVNDMGKMGVGADPPPGSWIEAHKAWFVAGSDYKGGMAEGEIVPFAEPAAAERFAAAHGGRVLAFAAVRDSDVLGYPEAAPREAGRAAIHR